jgi:PilZ domain
MIERRFESRFLCADLVKVDWLAGDGSSVSLRTVEAVLEDISPLGACVQLEESIPSGAAISISALAGPLDSNHTATFTGHVSYCVYRDYGYFVGIQFSNETRWSSGVFEPLHLTNLEALLH